MNKEEYVQYLEKFDEFKDYTTDDTFTPNDVMAEVYRYVSERWHLDPAYFVRPFWPGADYKTFNYDIFGENVWDRCVVVDNPPFSMISKIVRFYTERGISFFLFAPGLVILNVAAGVPGLTRIVGGNVRYENKALVPTGFITNLPGDNIIETEPELFDKICEHKAPRPRKVYDEHVIRSGNVINLCRIGAKVEIPRDEATDPIPCLDCGEKVFGSCILVSDSMAEKLRREKLRREKLRDDLHIPLSDREQEIIRKISQNSESLDS